MNADKGYIDIHSLLKRIEYIYTRDNNQNC